MSDSTPFRLHENNDVRVDINDQRGELRRERRDESTVSGPYALDISTMDNAHFS